MTRGHRSSIIWEYSSFFSEFFSMRMRRLKVLKRYRRRLVWVALSFYKEGLRRGFQKWYD